VIFIAMPRDVERLTSFAPLKTSKLCVREISSLQKSTFNHVGACALLDGAKT
jgi:hypothetical protein